MKKIPTIQFEPEEVATFRAALEGHYNLLAVETERGIVFPVRQHFNRITQHEEPYDAGQLRELNGVLDAMIDEWKGKTTAEAWREMGAPGSDEAVEGLAAQTRGAIDRVQAAQSLVLEALEQCGSGALSRVSPGDRKALAAEAM